MADFDNNEGEGGSGERGEEPTPRSFDPLFDPWDERDAAPSPGGYDDRFDFAPE